MAKAFVSFTARVTLFASLAFASLAAFAAPPLLVPPTGVRSTGNAPGVVTQAPAVAQVLRWVMFAWLLVLAWRISRAERPGQGAARPPLGFWGAAAFQWVNPKAWLLALTVNSVFILPGRPMAPQLALNFAVFLAVGMPCLLAWALLGSGAGRLLGPPLRLRIFNLTMAALLVISMLPMALGWE